MESATEWTRWLSIAFFVIAMASLTPQFGSAAAMRTPVRSTVQIGQNHTRPKPVPGSRAFISYRAESSVGCREASEEEVKAIKERSREALHIISSDRRNRTQSVTAESAGLQIILRGTDQLANFPAAKAGFLNAAATWEALIGTPITVVIDVDFGSRWFGERFGSNVLGQTDSQVLGDNSIYPELRDSLLGVASIDEQVQVYNKLPSFAVPTDIGTTSYVLAPSALWRTLGFINLVADPASEEADLGDPPATGFNSAFDYDFDPSDGVDSDKIDFDSVATHEIGHVLGFDSNTGYRELVPSSPVAVSIWD